MSSKYFIVLLIIVHLQISLQILDQNEFSNNIQSTRRRK
jgi:hypothetical protein